MKYKVLLIVAVISVLLLSGCVAIVMNRRFAGEEHFVDLGGNWSVGTPQAVALSGEKDRSQWNSQQFGIYIPISTTSKGGTGLDVVVDAITSRLVVIDEVTIYLHGSKDSLIRHTAVLPDDLHSESRFEPGGPAVTYMPGYYRSRDYMCVYVRGFDLPKEEDTITVTFEVQYRDTAEDEYKSQTLSFTLWRQEGKKLVYDPGK